jgi:hypothetical protein
MEPPGEGCGTRRRWTGMRRKWLDPRRSKVLKVAVGGTVLGLAGGATALAGVRVASPEPAPVDAPSDDTVSLDLEDGTVEVEVDDEIEDDLDGDNQGAGADVESVTGDTPPAQESVETLDSVDQDSVDADEESVDNQDQNDQDQESVDNDDQDDQSVDNDDQSSDSD